MNANYIDALARFLVARRNALCLASLLFALACASGLPNLRFNTSVDELLSDSDPMQEDLRAMAAKFPAPLTLSFAFTASGDGVSVFNQDTLAAMRDLERRYRELPGAVRLSSLLNYRSPVRNFVLFENGSEAYDEAALQERRVQALADPILVGTLLTDDARLTFASVTVAMDEGDPALRLALADATLALVQSLRAAHPGAGIYVNSDVLFERSTQDAMFSDLTTLLPFVILVCVLTICYAFHSFSFGACILGQALLSVLSTVGMVGIAGIGLNTISIIAPLIVVIISVAHSVHIISVFKQELFRDHGYEQAMERSTRSNLKPVFLATVTTAIGFLSLNLSSSPAIQDFGRIVGMGVGFALVYTFTLLPALLVWVSVKTRAHGRTMDAVLPARLIRATVRWWPRRERLLFGGFTLLGLGSLLLLPLNQTDFDRLDFIETDSEVGRYYEAVTERLGRGATLVYGIDAGGLDMAIEPSFLRGVESFSRWLLEQPEVSGAASAVELVKNIHQARGGGDPAYYRIPDDVYAIGNDLAVYQSIEFEDFPLGGFIDGDFSTIRLVVNARPLSNQSLIELDDRIASRFAENLPDASLLRGSAVLAFARMDDLITVELLQGYSLSLLLITATLVIGFGSLYFGFLSVIPNLLPATMVFGAWGLLVGQLDPFVMMLFSISIGLVVDDTVHILTHYLDHRKDGRPVETAFNLALMTAGPALVSTTAVLALGTTILIGASTLYFQQAARLLVPIVLLALVLDLVYLPTILKRFDRRERSGS